jgi:phosphatidylglycerophosphatase C
MTVPSAADGDAVAAFDFDGTMTRRDTVVPFLVELSGRTAVGRGLVAAARSRARSSDRDGMKAALLRVSVAGRTHAELVEAGTRYAQRLLPQIRPVMREQLEWHQARGHRTLIISASLHAYLDPLAATLGVDAVHAVELETDGRGVLTGRLARPNVRGDEKLRGLDGLVTSDPSELWVYGDASGDAGLLARATHPVPVTRRAHRFAPPR